MCQKSLISKFGQPLVDMSIIKFRNVDFIVQIMDMDMKFLYGIKFGKNNLQQRSLNNVNRLFKVIERDVIQFCDSHILYKFMLSEVFFLHAEYEYRFLDILSKVE